MNFSIESVYTWYRGLLRNPKYRWWVILGTALYFVSPIDVIPDFFPIVGELDDIFLLTLLFSEVSQLVIEGVKARKSNKNTEDSSVTTPSTVNIDAVSLK